MARSIWRRHTCFCAVALALTPRTKHSTQEPGQQNHSMHDCECTSCCVCRHVWTNVPGVEGEIGDAEVTSTKMSDVSFGQWAKDDRLSCITTRVHSSLSPQELELAMEFINHWTNVDFETHGATTSIRCKLIGNAWYLPMATHVLRPILNWFKEC